MQRHTANRPFSLSVLALAIAAGSGLGVPAMAQEERSVGLEEIVVTAQRREESLQETPIAITAFNAETITELGVFDIAQIGDFAPNVSIQRQPSSNSNMGVSIRGFSMGETLLIADPKVGLYVDGAYIGKTIGSVFDVADLERIEVLRGPQGTLFGRNTTGGALNVTTAKPSGELRGKAMASVGNDGYQRLGGSIDTPAWHDLAAKFSFNQMEYDGWAENNYTGPTLMPGLERSEGNLASEDNRAFRIALRWSPTEDITLDYSYDDTDNEGVPTPFQVTRVSSSFFNGDGSVTPFPFAFLGGALYQQMAATVGDPDDRRRRYTLDSVSKETLEVEGHTFTAAWDVSDQVTLKYIFSDRETQSGYASTDLDGGAYYDRDLFYGDFRGNSGAILKPGFIAAIAAGSIETTSHEFQIIGNGFDDRLQYTGGVFVYEEDTFQDNPQGLSIPIMFVAPRSAVLLGLYQAFGYCPAELGGSTCIGTQQNPIPLPADPGYAGLTDFYYGQNAKSNAGYGQATFAVTDKLDLTAGLRYTEDEKDAFMYNQGIAGLTPTTPIQADDEWNNWSYMVNGAYKFTDDMMVYLKYTTGYNSGGFSGRATTVTGFTSPVNEEEVETWELGLKSEWWDNRLRMNMAVFTNDYTDVQVAQFEAGSGGASSKQVNAGAATYEGFELDLTALPMDGLMITVAYGYLDAEYDEYLIRDGVTGVERDISSMTTVGAAPENTAAIGVQYDVIQCNWGAVVARLDATYKDEQVFHPYDNEMARSDDRWLINGRLSLVDIDVGAGADHGLRVDLWGKNMTDEEYREWAIPFGGLGFDGATWGQPRTFGLDLTYTYK